MPNPILDCMGAHRTVRQFLPDPVPSAHIETAVRAAQMAATSSWIQAYSLLQVSDPATRLQLAELAGGQAQVHEAGAFFLVLGDNRRHAAIQAQHGKPFEHNLEVFLTTTIDASLFAQNLTLAFESLGYGTCYIGAMRNDVARLVQVLDLPAHVYPFFGLCVGRPAQDPGLRPRLPLEAVWQVDRLAAETDLPEHIAAADALATPYYAERGQPKRNWSGAMARRFDHLEREPLRADYERQGARLD
ncbi:MAG: nitroreductase family protein [Planctomycetota bacterium]